MVGYPGFISGLGEIAAGFDAVVCDVWGVLHNGERAYPAAADALMRFRAARGPVLLLSNAPRPAPGVAAHLRALGVPEGAYDAILTSGDAVRAELARRAAARPGTPVLHIGPERDRPLIEGIDIVRTRIEQADLVLCSGLYDDETETPEDYRAMLAEAAARRLVMICANPDLKVERGDALIYCAGALAAVYETLGGTVLYFGKPHGPVYALATDRLAALAGRPLAPDRVLAIGDGLRTDVKGANAAGLRPLFVTAGLHAHELGPEPGRPELARVVAAAAREGARIGPVLSHLVW